MSEQFKPGDYAGKCTRVVSVEQREGFQWLMLEGRNEYVTSTAFVPVVPVSKIREVFRGQMQSPTNDLGHNSNLMAMLIGHNDCLHTVFEELTGEPLRKEST